MPMHASPKQYRDDVTSLHPTDVLNMCVCVCVRVRVYSLDVPERQRVGGGGGPDAGAPETNLWSS